MLRKIAAYLLAFPKSLLFNLYYFGLHGFKIPVLISHRVFLKKMKGEVIVEEKNFAKIKIGFGNDGILDKKRSRTIWEVNGTIRFEGSAFIGHGSKHVIHWNLTKEMDSLLQLNLK